VRVHDAARKHGVVDEDLLHAVRHAMRHVDLGDDMTMILGPDRTGRMLEVGVLDIDEEDPVIIHGMVMRQKFERFLRKRG
jgi:hypothetical protein